ncbi:hypothetical protein EDD11_004752 [Mortierella claussenii]|nr:hypothetical protein EDD11_004752 [Mortierella claussenii]
MSTFDGLIREFPTVAIDHFRARPGVQVYLLSHVHSDHLTGLAAKDWDAPLYCSPITATWLPMLASRSKQTAFELGQDRVLDRKYAHLTPFLRPLATDIPHYLDLGNGRQARLSLIPAHHCPGAVMFLLQDDRSCILYTGDARNETVDLQALSRMPIFTTATQRIDRLYLDTTYCHPAFQEFPSRDFVVSDLITFIHRRPRLAHYYIDAWTFGYEEIWIGLSKAFHTKIHVSPYLYQLYEAIDDMISPKVLEHLTLDGTTARFHSCRLGRTCGYGGAGSEHLSARELIRIQPNVSWFSPMLNKERRQQQPETDHILAQGTVVGRKSTFKIKEKLPPTIGKKDDLCYSNREILELLAKSMPPQERPLTLTVEEYERRQYERRRPCLQDGISTDFQSFYQAKGYQILDRGHPVLGTASNSSFALQTTKNSSGNSGNTRTVVPVTSSQTTFQSSPILSPRSSHLRKKMEKLKRQLRNTASLEEEEGCLEHCEKNEESTMEEGPLSLDLEALERKRTWWLETERGPSTTLEDISRIESSGMSSTDEDGQHHHSSIGLALDKGHTAHSQSREADKIKDDHDSCQRSLASDTAAAACDDQQVRGCSNLQEETDHQNSAKRESWCDQSTVELDPKVLTALMDGNNDSADVVGCSVQQSQQQAPPPPPPPSIPSPVPPSPGTPPHKVGSDLHSTVSTVSPISNKCTGYLSSSPDPFTSSDSWTADEYIYHASMLGSGTGSFPDQSSAASLPSPPLSWASSPSSVSPSLSSRPAPGLVLASMDTEMEALSDGDTEADTDEEYQNTVIRLQRETTVPLPSECQDGYAREDEVEYEEEEHSHGSTVPACGTTMQQHSQQQQCDQEHIVISLSSESSLSSLPPVSKADCNLSYSFSAVSNPPRTPPRQDPSATTGDPNIDLGESPSTSSRNPHHDHDHLCIQSIVHYASSGLTRTSLEAPKHNIFTQLAWSPPTSSNSIAATAVHKTTFKTNYYDTQIPKTAAISTTMDTNATRAATNTTISATTSTTTTTTTTGATTAVTAGTTTPPPPPPPPLAKSRNLPRWMKTTHLSRSKTDPHHGPDRVLKRHFSTIRLPKRAQTVVLEEKGKEVILIESSDEDGDGDGDSDDDGSDGERKGILSLQKQREKNLKRQRLELKLELDHPPCHRHSPRRREEGSIVEADHQEDRGGEQHDLDKGLQRGKKKMNSQSPPLPEKSVDNQDVAWLEYPSLDLSASNPFM